MQRLRFLPKTPSRLLTYFIIIVVVQSLFLIYLIAQKQYILYRGTPILLQVEPVDPRSLFSGDYVAFNYSISTLSLDDLPGDHTFKMGEPVYVVLEANNFVNVSQDKRKSKTLAVWTPVFVTKQYPELKKNQVMIRGIAKAKYSTEQQNKSKNYLSVWYGIEQYYVPETRERFIEREALKKPLFVKVNVDKNGQAAIAGLILGEEEINSSIF